MATPNKNQIEKKQQEEIRKFMSTGLDFTPFELDAGDGVVWKFSPDPQPSDTERLSKAMSALEEAQGGEGGSLQAAFGELVEAIKDRIMDEKQREQFPLPVYGANALMWFSLHLATGRDGFPTE